MPPADSPFASPAAPVAVALDGLSETDALALARLLAGRVWGFKVNDLLLNSGVAIVERLKPYGKVFCDPKLHDIPNTVANEVRVLAAAGADLVTVHASGGAEMLQAARAARPEGVGLLAVTVLTSIGDATARRVYGRPVTEQVRALAGLAAECDLDGVVCSPQELTLLAEVDPAGRLARVTPGVRPAWYGRSDDQQRARTPAQALRDGAHLLVVGRPITADPDPLAACERIAAELGR